MPKKHYLKHTKIYSVWNEMRSRCQNPNDSSYHRYGAKGISVCDEWNDFRVFYPWAMGSGYKEGLTLDRIDPSGNYEPSNCRWITQVEQQRNRGNNVRLEHNGEKLTIKEWCEKLGFPYTSAKSRYYRHLHRFGVTSFEDTFGQKPNYRNRRIAQYSLTGELLCVWDKIADIERAGFKHGSISKCCSGKLSKTQGYKWKYYD
jgi:hypothetical protein